MVEVTEKFFWKTDAAIDLRTKLSWKIGRHVLLI
jgi:hypothetical protein